MVVGAREGRSLASLGRPRDILRCNVRLLVMRLSSVGTDQCAILRIVATVIDYFSLLVTACHRIITAWRLSLLERTNIVSYYSLERASIISIP